MNQEVACFDFSHLAKTDISAFTPREKIEIIEYYLFDNYDNIADELPVLHNVCGGMYDRELEIPAGTLLTGKIHTKEHIFFLTKGDLSVMTDEGMKRIQAPYRVNVKAGTKKIGYAHSDVLCTTIHATNETEIDKIEDELFKDSDLTWVQDMIKKIEVQQ